MKLAYLGFLIVSYLWIDPRNNQGLLLPTYAAVIQQHIQRQKHLTQQEAATGRH